VASLLFNKIDYLKNIDGDFQYEQPAPRDLAHKLSGPIRIDIGDRYIESDFAV